MAEEKKKAEPVIQPPKPQIEDDMDLDDDEIKEQIEKVWNPQLLQACKDGDEASLKMALEKGADIY